MIGITFLQLRNELQDGIRLPSPQSCPPPIASLIQQCFVEDPTYRPFFTEIKTIVELAYSQLRRSPEERTQIECIDEEKLDYADLQLEERYLDMKG